MGSSRGGLSLYASAVPRITFLPADVTVEVHPGTTVFNAAAKAEVAIPSQCGGKCACALCRVEVVSGEELVSPMTWEEEGHMGNVFHLTRERLSCQLRVFGDLVVKIDEAPAKEQPRGRYIPYSIIRKREKMEQDEELRRVRGDGPPRPPRRDRAPAPPRPRPAPARADAPLPETTPPETAPPAEVAAAGPPRPNAQQPPGPSSKGPKRRRRRKRRNPGAPRPGESRPPSKDDS